MDAIEIILAVEDMVKRRLRIDRELAMRLDVGTELGFNVDGTFLISPFVGAVESFINLKTA